MGFLDNSSITVDAILTKIGRKRISDGSFRVSKFSLSDEEIDYTLYDVTHPNGTDAYGTAIENMNLLEAVSNRTETVLCSSPEYFNGNCHTNPRALYIQWNYQNNEKRLVGTGVYFVKLDYTINVMGRSKGSDEFENSWGVVRSTDIENARVVE